MRFFTHSVQRVRKNHTVMPSTNLSGAIPPNQDRASIAVWFFVTGPFSNRKTLRRLPSHLCSVMPSSGAGELEQIQFLLEHASVQTTERYLGCKQRLSQAVNDKLGLEDT